MTMRKSTLLVFTIFLTSTSFLISQNQTIKQIGDTNEQPKQENTNKLNESTNLNIATDPRPEIESDYDGLTTPEQTENKRIPVPEHVEPEQPKRGWLSRFFLPNG